LNKVTFVSSYSYTTPRALDIKQEVEQVRSNVFHSRCTNVFCFFFWNIFTSLHNSMQSQIRSPSASKVFTTMWIGIWQFISGSIICIIRRNSSDYAGLKFTDDSGYFKP